MAPDADILLVEDNPADAELTLHTLLEAGVTAGIRVVPDGEEALDYLLCRGAHAARSPDAPPKLVLLDLKLPKVDGLEVLRRLKAGARTRGVPVVMLTSSNVERDVVEAYRLGANSYVQKPVDFDRFRQALITVATYWLTINEPPPVRTFLGEPA